jgi:hypothetical protein
VSAAFVQQLDVAAVRRAWRKLAVAIHPDAARRGARGTADGRQFVEASRAYELLMGYLLAQPVQPHPARRGPAEKRAAAEKRSQPERRGPAEKRGGADRRAERHTASERHAASERRGAAERHTAPLFYRGSVPRRRLRLAEYLYYSGRISWQSLISALVWQRASQPRFGELARELRSISAPDLVRILGSRLRQEYTGEAAQRLEILTAAQVERILRLQRARRRLIGRYFVEEERMSAAVLTSILFELYRHNARWGRPQ